MFLGVDLGILHSINKALEDLFRCRQSVVIYHMKPELCLLFEYVGVIVLLKTKYGQIPHIKGKTKHNYGLK